MKLSRAKSLNLSLVAHSKLQKGHMKSYLPGFLLLTATMFAGDIANAGEIAPRLSLKSTALNEKSSVDTLRLPLAQETNGATPKQSFSIAGSRMTDYLLNGIPTGRSPRLKLNLSPTQLGMTMTHTW